MNFKEIYLHYVHVFVCVFYGGKNTKLLKSADVIAIGGDSTRYYCFDGVHFSLLLDPVVKELQSVYGYEVISIARPFSRFFGADAFNDPISINTRMLPIKLIKDFLSLIRVPNEFNFANLFERRAYERILAMVNPKVIIGIEIPTELIKASKKRKITTIEFLHGRGIEKLPPQFANKTGVRLPDLFFCYDECSENTFLQLQPRGPSTIVVQHPSRTAWFEERINFYQKLDSRLQRRRLRHAVITTQWGFSGDLDDDYNGIQKMPNGLFSPELEKAIVNSRETIFWHIRLHPVLAIKPGYSSILKKIKQFCEDVGNAEWTVATDSTISEIFLFCDSHVTMCSGAVYDASDLGVKSLVLCGSVGPNGNRPTRFDELVCLGLVKKEEAKTDQIIEWVMRSRKVNSAMLKSGVKSTLLIKKIAGDAASRKLPKSQRCFG